MRGKAGQSMREAARRADEEAAQEGGAILQPLTLPPELQRLIAEQGREGSLAEEIGALRVVLAQLLATGGADAAALSQSVPRVVNAIVRAQRTQRLLAGESAGDLNEMMTRILADMGLAERRMRSAEWGIVTGGLQVWMTLFVTNSPFRTPHSTLEVGYGWG